MEQKSKGPKTTKPRRVRDVRASGVNNSEVIHVENHSTNVIPFKFDQREVRTMLINDQPWFVAGDVAAALEYAVAKDMTRNLDDDEKGRQIVPTLGGDQEMTVINESGLYSAILRSRKAEAKRFKKWVTAEVLPAIRKHGRYVDEQGRMPTLVSELIGMSELNVIKGTIRDKGKDVAHAKRRSFHAAMCSRLHTRFNVPRLEMIPADQFEAACNFVAAFALEGEWIEARRQEGVISFSDDEAQDMHLVLSYAKRLLKMRDQLYGAGQALDSRVLIEGFSYLADMQLHVSRLDRQKSGELARLHEQRTAPARRAAA